MNHWILQANPRKFDVDAYLRKTSRFVWTVRDRAKEMEVGDQVFIWRAAGKSPSGIVAMGELTSRAQKMKPDRASKGCWRDGKLTGLELRVRGVVHRKCIDAEEVVRRDSLLDDKVVCNMRILQRAGASHMNFLITPEHAERLTALVEKRFAVRSQTYANFGDAPNDDPYELQLFAARVRRGQPVFRKNLMAAYDRRCVISGHGPEDALNAVHIEPHAQSGINELDNGLLMRADLHSLFDVGLLRINPKSLRVVIDSSLRNTPYEEFDGRKIGARRDGKQPSARYLKKRWDGKVFDL